MELFENWETPRITPWKTAWKHVGNHHGKHHRQHRGQHDGTHHGNIGNIMDGNNESELKIVQRVYGYLVPQFQFPEATKLLHCFLVYSQLRGDSGRVKCQFPAPLDVMNADLQRRVSEVD